MNVFETSGCFFSALGIGVAVTMASALEWGLFWGSIGSVVGFFGGWVIGVGVGYVVIALVSDGD